MNILFISPLKLWGGAATANIAICKILVNLGHTVIYNNEYSEQESYDGISIDKTNFHAEHKRWASDIIELVKEKDIEMIIWNNSMTFYYYSTIKYLKKKGIVNIAIIHSLSLNQNIKGRIIDYIYSLTLANLNGIVYVSDFTFRSWNKFYAIRHSKAIQHTIHNSIEPTGEKTSNTILSNKARLGFVGRFSIEKQPERFCQLSLDNQFELHAFGKGPLLNYCKQNYPGVIYHGLERDQNQIYSRFDILVLTSKFENCPMVILEALSRGIPCIAQRVGGIPEILVDGESGILYDNFEIKDLQDKVNRVICDYSRYSQNAIKASENFFSSSISYKWFNLIKELSE